MWGKFWQWLTNLFQTAAKSAPAVGGVQPVASDSSSFGKLFSSMAVRDSWRLRAEAAAEKVLKGRARYEAVEAETGVPWHMIGVIHLLEGNCSFSSHLHNGDPLSARTKNVPAGRPKTGSAPFAWEFSAKDALSYDGVKPPLNTVGLIFDKLERFNGTGYRNKGINTPYLWSGSSHYTKGKYVADGKYDANAVSAQVGAAVVYKIFAERGIVKFS